MATMNTADTSSQVDLSDEERQSNVFWYPFVVFKKDSLENYIAHLSSSSRERLVTEEQRTASNPTDQNKVSSAKLKRIFSRRLSDILGRELSLDSSIDLSLRLKSEDQSAIEVHGNENAQKSMHTAIQQGVMGSISPISNSAKEKNRLSVYLGSRPNSYISSTVGSQDCRRSYSTYEWENRETKGVPVTETMNETHFNVIISNTKFNEEANTTGISNTLEGTCQVVYQNSVVQPSSSGMRRHLNVSASQGGIRNQESRRFFPRESWELHLWDYESLCRRQSQQYSRASTDRLLSSMDSRDLSAEKRLHSLLTQILYPQVDTFDDVTSGCSLKRCASDSRKSFGRDTKDNSVTDHHISLMDCNSPRFTRESRQFQPNLWGQESNSLETERTKDGYQDLNLVVSREVLKGNHTKSDAPTEYTSKLLNADPKEGLNSCVVTPTPSKFPSRERPPGRFLPSRIPQLSNRPSKGRETPFDYISKLLSRQRREAHSYASQKAKGSNRSSRVGFKLNPRVTFSPLLRVDRRNAQTPHSNSAPTRSRAIGDGHAPQRKPTPRNVVKRGNKSRAKAHAHARRTAKLRLSRQVLKVIQKLLVQIEELEKLFSRLQNREEGLREEMDALLHAYEDSWKNYLHTVSQYSYRTLTDTGDFSSKLRTLMDAGVQLNPSNETGQRRIIL